MDPEEDYMTIAEAEELMAKTEGVRKKELDDAHAKLRGSHTATMKTVSQQAYDKLLCNPCLLFSSRSYS